MILRKDLRKTAKARLRDAEVLLRFKRYDSAIYVCGYSVELALKARISRTLKWRDYPSTQSEFKNYQSFRTHDLDVLLHLSGLEEKVKLRFFAEWSVVAQWNPSARYLPVGSTKSKDARLMISAAKRLLEAVV